MSLAQGESLQVGIDLADAAEGRAAVRLCIQAEGLSGPDDLSVSLNGQTLAGSMVNSAWVG